MPRAFVAVLLPEGPRRAIATEIDRLKMITRTATWVAPNNLHITLRFLGDQTEEQLAGVVPALEEAAEGVAPFTLTLRGLGAFPGPEHPRTLWVGISEGATEVRRLQARVAEALERLGVPLEVRHWQAHVTIGRVTEQRRMRREGVAELRSAIIRGATTNFGPVPVTAISLMRSDLYSSGARYTGIASVALNSEYNL